MSNECFQAVRKSPICHCRLCKKCFKNYCENLARNVSVSEFICPGCSFPDVNANPDEALMYFEYLSQQVKKTSLDIKCFASNLNCYSYNFA